MINIIINDIYTVLSSQVATQLRNGAANALNQLRDVEQISVQFVSEYLYTSFPVHVKLSYRIVSYSL